MLFVFFSCDFSTRENRFIPNTSFYNTWNESTKVELRSCCADEELKSYLDNDLKRMFRFRTILFDSLIEELPKEGKYVIEELFSKSSEASIHRMIVSTKEFGKEASINYKGEIKIDTVKLKPLPLIQANPSNCCPYTIEEFEKYDGYLLLKCMTFLEVKKEPNEFKIQLSIN